MSLGLFASNPISQSLSLLLRGTLFLFLLFFVRHSLQAFGHATAVTVASNFPKRPFSDDQAQIKLWTISKADAAVLVFSAIA